MQGSHYFWDLVLGKNLYSPVRGGLCQQAELREEGGEQAIWGGGASTWAELFAFLKPNWEKIFQKVKVSLVDVFDCFVYICVSS